MELIVKLELLFVATTIDQAQRKHVVAMLGWYILHNKLSAIRPAGRPQTTSPVHAPQSSQRVATQREQQGGLTRCRPQQETPSQNVVGAVLLLVSKND